MATDRQWVVPFNKLGIGDIPRVGGKNASLGEMIHQLRRSGIRVPEGFATTADAYRRTIADNDLERRIRSRIENYRAGKESLETTGRSLRALMRRASLPDALEDAVRKAYRELDERAGGTGTLPVAVRSSATAEDLPDASFAGQQESYLNVRGEDEVVAACRKCFASLFTDRAIVYRENRGYDHLAVALSVGVQRMVRADLGAAGVMFSIDTESGFEGAVLINGNWGLGETVVQGQVDPDEFLVFKPALSRRRLRPIIRKRCGSKTRKLVYSRAKGGKTTKLQKVPAPQRRRLVLDEDQVLQLARWAVAVERHYDKPMDMEWALDGEDGKLYMLQARPETVQSRRQGALRRYHLDKPGKLLATGRAVGEGIAAGQVCRLTRASQGNEFPAGGVLVTGRTDPDWVPVMKRAAAIVTDEGGRTSHAASVSRELGLPALVGCGDATERLDKAREVTVSCAEGDTGHVYQGRGEIRVEELSLEDIPDTRTDVMLNLADPDAALQWWRLPADGVGLARMEFIINNHIRVHPLALLHPEALNADDRRRVRELTRVYDTPEEYFVERLALGIAPIAAAFHPEPVIVRMSDFKTDEYANLIGGAPFEPPEANPMIGWRGASRYYSEEYREGFALECQAIRRVRETMGLDNVVVMIPFCRTPAEADKVLREMARNGLVRGRKGLSVYVMCEIPSNVVLAEAFARRFDGFSIGSNDLTQLTLGIDRNSARLAPLFDDQDEAVKRLIAQVIEEAHRHGAKVGLCGQAPSDHPDFADFLVEAGIDSMSVNPDSFVAVKSRVAAAEKALK